MQMTSPTIQDLVLRLPHVTGKEDLIRDVYKARIQFFSMLAQLSGASALGAAVSAGATIAAHKPQDGSLATSTTVIPIAMLLVGASIALVMAGICAWKAYWSAAELVQALAVYNGAVVLKEKVDQIA